MELTSFKQEHLPEIAALFVANFKRLRQQVPALPDAMENPQCVVELLHLLVDKPGVVALDGGSVVGYLGAFLVDEFRGTGRRAAYVPEWGHVAASPEVYHALYREASTRWFEAGCAAHAVSLLAHDHAAEKVWFWNGFGLTVVDAIRPINPLGNVASVPVRKATLEDVEALTALEAEHARHYQEPPVFMVDYEAGSAAMIAEFMNAADSSYWVALNGDAPVGFIRFERNSGGAAAIVDAPDKIAISGAYVSPQVRGRGAGKAILNAALGDYTAQGFARCSVDFESFNPEAATFWMKYFEPVCLSVIRVPERSPG